MKLNAVKGKNKLGRETATDKVFCGLLLLLFVLNSCTDKPKEKQSFSDFPLQDTLIIEPVIQQQEIVKTSLELSLDSLGLKGIQENAPAIRVDLKYATTDNFTGKVLYRQLKRAYLHPLAMEKLMKAQNILHQTNPDLFLLVYDAARPHSVQREMYDAVKNTKYKAYVANPERTSLHNYGMAVDLTICDRDTVALDMGTDFDYFGSKAGINQEEALIRQGVLTREQVDNRMLLRNVMKEAGFFSIRGEWWHFNACSLGEAKQLTALIE